MYLDSNKLENKNQDFKELLTFESSLLHPNIWYAININPDDAHQFFDHPQRGEMFNKNLLKYYQKLKASAKCTLILECSQPKDPTTKTRLHVHGVIKFTPVGVAKWYMFHRNMLIKYNAIVINPIKNPKTWVNYLEKDRHFMKNVFCQYFDMPYPLFNDHESLKEFTEYIKPKIKCK